MSWPDDETRKRCGDVLLVGGTFFLKGTLDLGKISFPVRLRLHISDRGIALSRVALAESEPTKEPE